LAGLFSFCVTGKRVLGDGEDGHIHDGRAFSATEAKRQGLDPQKLLNHTDAATVRIYLRGREIEVVTGPQLLRKSA
jgi:hypothetical protein